MCGNCLKCARLNMPTVASAATLQLVGNGVWVPSQQARRANTLGASAATPLGTGDELPPYLRLHHLCSNPATTRTETWTLCRQDL